MHLSLNLPGRMLALQHMPRESVGAEIGVHLGDFSNQILNVAKPRKLYLIDPYRHFDDAAHQSSLYGDLAGSQTAMDQRFEDVRARFAPQIERGEVTMLRDLSVNAAKEIEDASLDYVYIDGDHLYEAVKEDIGIYFDKVKPGGLIFGDDYELGSWWGDGVVRAFHEALNELPLKIEFLVDTQICCRRLG